MKKVFVAHASSYDYKNELYRPLRSSQLNSIYDFFLPKEKNEDEVITKDTIQNSDIIIAEVSYPSTGQGIELGWADIYNKRIICIYKQGNKYSQATTKLTQTYISYVDTSDLIAKIGTVLNVV